MRHFEQRACVLRLLRYSESYTRGARFLNTYAKRRMHSDILTCSDNLSLTLRITVDLARDYEFY